MPRDAACLKDITRGSDVVIRAQVQAAAGELTVPLEGTLVSRRKASNVANRAARQWLATKASF